MRGLYQEVQYFALTSPHDMIGCCPNHTALQPEPASPNAPSAVVLMVSSIELQL